MINMWPITGTFVGLKIAYSAAIIVLLVIISCCMFLCGFVRSYFLSTKAKGLFKTVPPPEQRKNDSQGYEISVITPNNLANTSVEIPSNKAAHLLIPVFEYVPPSAAFLRSRQGKTPHLRRRGKRTVRYMPTMCSIKETEEEHQKETEESIVETDTEKSIGSKYLDGGE